MLYYRIFREGVVIMNIKNIMKQENHVAKENDTIDHILKLINKVEVNGMPVVDASDNLVGMVVKADIYRFMMTPGHYDTCPVEWVMTKSVITAEADEDVLTVAKRIRENDIISMPVMEDKKVIGIISIEDILDYFIKKE